MFKQIGWHFPDNGGGQVAGFNDSGIETFAGQPFESLAREIIQNSLDARASKQKAVVVHFELVRISATDFPAHGEMLHIVGKCLDASQEDEKAKDFFKNAQQILQGGKITCLKISDSNTKGLQDGKNGDSRSGDWHRLIKATGKPQTEKLAGGSYGIGKNAPFAVSNLRTVFYTTRYGSTEYAQGKAILVSHAHGNGDTQAVGFYGVTEKCERLESNIPPILSRAKSGGDGTTLLVAGLKEETEWDKKVVAAIISNFFFAINATELVVKITKGGNDLVVDQASLPKFLGYPHPQETDDKFFRNLWQDESVKTARAYYQALKDGCRIAGSPSPLGHCVLWVAKEMDFPQQVAILRRGMKITSDLPRLRGWNGFYDFAAVCICEDSAGNKLLRGMENPAHDSFEPARLGKKQSDGKKALNGLAKWVREEIKKIAEESVDEPVSLDRMSEFFPSEEDTLPGENSDRDFEGRPVISPKPMRYTGGKTLDIDDDSDEDDGHDHEHTEGGGGGGNGTGNGGGSGARTKKSMHIESVRVLSAGKDNLKRVWFTPRHTGKGELTLQIAGDSFIEKVSIANVQGAGVKKAGGKFVLDVQDQKRVCVTVELSESVNESFSVTMTEVGKKSKK